MSAVDKVIALLEELQAKVMSEGEEEAKTYNKFACFCKDTTAEKTESIEKGQDEKESLTATIGELSAKRDELDAKIEGLVKEIKEAEAAMKAAAEQRAKTLAEYEKNEADLSGAIQVLKASKTPSLLQLQSVAKTVRKAALMAEALGLGGATAQRAVAMLLQETPEVPMQDYDFHSDGIIETLEKLLKDFGNEKAEIDAAEVKSVAEHDAFMQEKTDFVKRKNAELTTVAAVLLDDQEYLKELSAMCELKAKTWDQRTQCRQDELSALTAAISIIKGAVSEKTTAATIRFAQQGVSVRLAAAVAGNEGAMEAVEAEAEAADDEEPLAFLQKQAGKP